MARVRSPGLPLPWEGKASTVSGGDIPCAPWPAGRAGFCFRPATSEAPGPSPGQGSDSPPPASASGEKALRLRS